MMKANNCAPLVVLVLQWIDCNVLPEAETISSLQSREHISLSDMFTSHQMTRCAKLSGPNSD